jgi:predicted HAD superfamily Cof-like phosphohydrolase
MEKQILQTLEFQTIFKPESHEIPGKPTMPSEEIRALRQSLIDEEVEELANAKTIEDATDAIIDCLYVLLGTAHEYGIADRLVQLFDEVHRSNMSKVSEDGTIKYREDGKVLKPDTFKKADMARVLTEAEEHYVDVTSNPKSLF